MAGGGAPGGGFLRDRDGRLPSWVFAETLQTAPVQGVLVREGLAMVDVREVVDRELAAGCFPVGYADSLLEAQRQAALARRGLWGLPPFCPEADFLVAGIKHWGDVEEVYLINRGGKAIELSAGWMLMDETAHAKWVAGGESRNLIPFQGAFAGGCTLPPGGVLVIRTGPGIPESERKRLQGCGTGQVILNWFGYKMWNTEGDTAYLYGPDGELICSFRYPWQGRSP